MRAIHAKIPQRVQDQLPDRCFAYVEPGGTHDKPGFTKPRSKRHLLIVVPGNRRSTIDHIHDAEARFDQTQFHSEAARRTAWAKIVRAAKRFGAKVGSRLGTGGHLVPKGRALAAAHSEAIPGDAPEWVNLIPVGEFSGRDGRGPFQLDDPESVIKATQALDMSAGIPIDFDHSTDFAAPAGNPAPAAGWIKALAVRDGFLCGRVEWTPAGAKALAQKMYRYISPVFEHAKDGTVQRLLRAGLTNNPNLKLPAIASAEDLTMASAHAKKSKLQALVDDIKETAEEIGLPVDTLLEGISHQLGGDLEDPDHGGADDQDDDGEAPISADAGDFPGAEDDDEGGDEDDEDEAAVAARHREEAAARESAGAVETPAEREERMAREKEELAAARERMESRRKARRDMKRAGRLANLERDKKRRGDKDPREDAERELRSHHMVASHPAIVAMARELRALRAEREREKAELAVNEAIRAHRLTPAQRGWATRLYLESPARFEEFVASAPAMLPDSDGTFRGVPSGTGAERSLTRTEMAICSQLRLDPKAFAERLRNRELSARG